MVNKQTKFIFVTGGVLSGLGKGITAASIGSILKSQGLNVNMQKLDPYLNVDAGTLNPAEHGECFVTKDGAETDLDLGHYERFLDVELTQDSSIMSGRILRKLIEDERQGKFMGKTVQLVPHFTNAIQGYIQKASEGFDVHIVEVGGTVGDYESPAFFEAIREFCSKVGPENSMNVQVVYMPYLDASKEIKTKPAQNAIRQLRSLGIIPDLLIARCETDIAEDHVRKKLSLLGGVPDSGIAVVPNADTVYEVPLNLQSQNIDQYICNRLGLKKKRPNLKKWASMVELIKAKPKNTVTIGIVAKYLDNDDAYMCVVEALKSASWHQGVGVDYRWINAEDLANSSLGERKAMLGSVDGVIVPGGFGERALEGKISAAQFCLDNKTPYLGLCLGLQMAVVAAARNAGIDDAVSEEMSPVAENLVISAMPDQKELVNTGGTMRLGNYPCKIEKKSIAHSLYKSSQVQERHRHRFECNNDFRDQYEAWGIRATGTSPDGNLVEIIEAIDHPFFVASQFHPELKSRPNRPHPLFSGFVASLLVKSD